MATDHTKKAEVCGGDQGPHCHKLQHPTSTKRRDSGFIDDSVENGADGCSTAHTSYDSKDESLKLQPLKEEEEVTNREEKDRPYLRKISRSDTGFCSMPSGDVTPQESIEMDPDTATPCTFEVEQSKAILLFIDDGSIAVIRVPIKRIDTDSGECSGRVCSHKEDLFSFYTNISGEKMTLEAVVLPCRGPGPVRLVPVTGPPSQDETFTQRNMTGKPGYGTTGELKSVAGGYVALRVDTSDPRVAHLKTYNEEAFKRLLSSGDKYTLANLTTLHCLKCSKWRQVAMYYTSENFDYRYYVIPSSGNEVEIKAVKKMPPDKEEDIDAYATYGRWMEVTSSTSS